MEDVRKNNVPGDYVECGVWRAGNILGMASYLKYHNNTNPQLWLYDTFAGMTVPEDVDLTHDGKAAINIYQTEAVNCLSPIEDVHHTLSHTDYPVDKFRFVVGDICQTLLRQENIPDGISILRLDTDWYASTKIELEVLWDKLSPGGFLIIDDYGHWQGCRKAVDEFFPDHSVLEYIDYTCRLVRK
jgi:hypothetical protein